MEFVAETSPAASCFVVKFKTSLDILIRMGFDDRINNAAAIYVWVVWECISYKDRVYAARRQNVYTQIIDIRW